jgi:DNA-directed RNA polymerase sigma subunit (sigma70/sigma32)
MNDGGREQQPYLKDEPSDEVVEDFIAKHPDGASCDAIGEVLGVCSVRVRQILKSALEKALRVAKRRDVHPSDYAKHETVWDRIANS